MKRFLLPLAVCAALAGCADYGTVAYGNYPAYPAYPAYSTSPYAYDSGYGYVPYGPGWVYGGPSVSLGFGGTYGGGYRGYHEHEHEHEHGWRGGEHHGSAREWQQRAGTHAMGAGPARFRHDRSGAWQRGGHVAGRRGGPRAERDHDEHHPR